MWSIYLDPKNARRAVGGERSFRSLVYDWSPTVVRPTTELTALFEVWCGLNYKLNDRTAFSNTELISVRFPPSRVGCRRREGAVFYLSVFWVLLEQAREQRLLATQEARKTTQKIIINDEAAAEVWAGYK